MRAVWPGARQRTSSTLSASLRASQSLRALSHFRTPVWRSAEEAEAESEFVVQESPQGSFSILKSSQQKQ
ncbi:hypothetical protein AAFF_G00192840 [Aldrovandia affinis]|uniref:Uncharacterized protein n=1 Tax=Aldrovandia affinis TaxID=143900 RepID=A0AAD7RJ67_9TELE|nr:hypothetical protein AAFF_G00192840 [Aldrovandia affinis]